MRLFSYCQAQKDNRIKTIKEFLKSDKELNKSENNGMAKPIMLSATGGSDISPFAGSTPRKIHFQDIAELDSHLRSLGLF